MKLTLGIVERFRQRKAAYQTVFRGPFGADVLADLAKFCCGFETTAGLNAHDMALNEGKRLVWIRIMKHLNFTPEELAVHYDATLRIPD